MPGPMPLPLAGNFVAFLFVSRDRLDFLFLKGMLRDHSSDIALNFHQIQDFCIFLMVLDA